MFKGWDGKCKCLVELTALPRIRAATEAASNCPAVTSVAALSFNMLPDDVEMVSSPLLLVEVIVEAFNIPSAVISHEEIIREAKMYS